MAAEPIGQLDVVISGDYSELQQALDAAAKAATAGAQEIANAFNSANIAQTANDGAGQIQVMAAAFGDASLQVQSLGRFAYIFGEEMETSLTQVNQQIQALNGLDFSGSFERAAAAAQALADAVGKVQPPLQQVGNSVQQVGDAAPGVKATADSFDEITNSIQQAAAALALYDIGKWVLDQAESFQEATQQIVANTGQIGDQLATLQGDFQTVFAQVPQSAADVGAALGLITSKLGETGDTLDGLAKTLADISTITGDSLESLASKATSTFNQWRVATDDQIQELTNLLHVAEAAGVPLTQLLGQLNQFGPAAREMGLGLDETAQILGSLDQQGYNTQQVFMSLRQEINKLAKADVPDAAASLQTWVDSIKNAATETEAMAIASTAGARGASALVDAIRSGALDFDNFAGKLNITSSSINDQAQAAETLGQIWSTVVHQLDVDFGGALTGIVNTLKQLGLATIDFLSAPAAYAKVAADEILSAFLSMEINVLESFAQHPILAYVLGGPGAADLINAEIQSVGRWIVGLNVDMATTIASFNQQKAAADSLTTSLNNLGGSGGAGVLPQVGKDFDSLNSDLYTVGETLDKLAQKMPADFADFQAGVAQGMNFSSLDKQFADLQQQLDRTGEDATDFGLAATDAIDGFRVTLAQFIQDANLIKAGDAFDALNDRLDKLNQKDLSHLAAQIGNLASVSQALGQDSPYAKLNSDLTALGITADGTTSKMSKEFSAFNDLATNSGATLNEIEGAWAKIQGDITKISSGTGGLGSVVMLSDEYLAALQKAGASQSQLLAATTSVYTAQLKVAEAAGQSSDEILKIGINLDNARAKQNAFNDSTQGLLTLYTGVQKEFATAWTEFGTGIADAIVGAKSFGSAIMGVLDDMEKKITELVVNYMLGQLKDSFLQNTNALSDFGKVFTEIFGGGPSGGGGMAGTAVNAGGLGNLPIQGAGTVQSGATTVANGITQMTTGIIGTLGSLVNLLTGIGQLITGIISDIEQAHTNTLLDRIELNTRQAATYLSSTSGGMLDYLAKMLQQEGDLTSAFTGWFHDALASLMTTVEDIDAKTGIGGGTSSGGGGTSSSGSVIDSNTLELAIQTALSDSGLLTGTTSVSSAASSLSSASSALSSAASDTTAAAGVLTTAADGTISFTGSAADEIKALTQAGQPIPASLTAIANDPQTAIAANTAATVANTAAVVTNTPSTTYFGPIDLLTQALNEAMHIPAGPGTAAITNTPATINYAAPDLLAKALTDAMNLPAGPNANAGAGTVPITAANYGPQAPATLTPAQLQALLTDPGLGSGAALPQAQPGGPVNFNLNFSGANIYGAQGAQQFGTALVNMLRSANNQLKFV